MPVNRFGNEDMSTFFQGAQVGNMMALRAERQQQLQSEAALRAVQERHLAAQADQLAWQLKQAQEQKVKDDIDLQTHQLFTGKLVEAGLPPAEAQSTMNDWLANRNPKLAKDVGQAQYWMDRPEMAQAKLASQEKIAQLRVNPRLDSFGQAWEGYQKAMQSGDETAIKDWHGRIQRLSGQLPSSALREGEDLANARVNLDKVNEALKTNPDNQPLQETQKRLQTVVDSMESRHNTQEISMTTPEGTTLRVGKQQKDTDITPATRSTLEKDDIATSNALRNIVRLRQQLTNGTVGLGPALENFMLDKVLGQFDPDLVNAQRVKARQNISLATQGILGELGTRQRFSNQELNAIRGVMPSLGGAENTENAQLKLNEVALMLAEKGAAASQRLKKPTSPEVLQTLANLFPGTQEGQQALQKEMRDGLISPDVAMQVRKYLKKGGQ